MKQYAERTFRRVTGVFLFLCAFSGYGVAYAAFFSDVLDHTYYRAIDYVRVEGFMKGYEDGTFRPDVVLNRAELMKVAMRAREAGETVMAGDVGSEEVSEQEDEIPSDSCFQDVPADAWFAPFVCEAKKSGIVSGYEDGTFRPSQRVTVAEAAKILTKSYGLSVSAPAEPWFLPYLELLGSKRVLPETFVYFNQGVTRGELAEMVWRLGLSEEEEVGTQETEETSETAETEQTQVSLLDLRIANVDRLANQSCLLSPENVPRTIDMSRVRETWLKWNNDARTAAGLHAYTYND
ncbi:MAG TPA: S-layer homology domain-containing protein, partial [Candidatus Gracilibacteria bacterium]|nr:S-layer homology domain-containing protein [Candidatus Gracilibacteria bacterium]